MNSSKVPYHFNITYLGFHKPINQYPTTKFIDEINVVYCLQQFFKFHYMIIINFTQSVDFIYSKFFQLWIL